MFAPLHGRLCAGTRQLERCIGDHCNGRVTLCSGTGRPERVGVDSRNPELAPEALGAGMFAISSCRASPHARLCDDFGSSHGPSTTLGSGLVTVCSTPRPAEQQRSAPVRLLEPGCHRPGRPIVAARVSRKECAWADRPTLLVAFLDGPLVGVRARKTPSAQSGSGPERLQARSRGQALKDSKRAVGVRP